MSKGLSPRRPGAATTVRTIVLMVITVLVIVPIAAVVVYAFQPTGGNGWTLGNFALVFGQSNVPHALGNSLLVSCVTTVLSVVFAASAGYVVSRSRSRFVAAYALVLFIFKTLPFVVLLFPLFLIFARLGLVDTLQGLVVVYVASSMIVATWMMSSYFDSIPYELEEASYLDGCGPLRAYLRVILPNALPGILSVSIFSFLLSWNDYLAALIMLRTTDLLTLPLAIQVFVGQEGTQWGPMMASAVVMMVPPIVLFAVFQRYFSVGGVTGALGK